MTANRIFGHVERTREDTSQVPASRPHWGAGIIMLHWSTALCVVALVVTGWQLRPLTGDLAPYAVTLRLHASLGVVVLVVTIVRVVARLAARPPSASTEGRLRRAGVVVVQAALYVTLFALVATGIVAAAPRPFMPAVQLFGLWPLPKIAGVPPEMMRSVPRIHAMSTWTLLALVGLHVAAAIYGTLVRERTIFRMLPWPRHRSTA